jgi:hypothetical protein
MYKRKRVSSEDQMDEPTQTTSNIEKASINPSNEATFRALKNICSKNTQCEHHITLLEEHLMNGTTPKGLASTIQPNVPHV